MLYSIIRSTIWNRNTGRARAIWRVLVPALSIILVNSVIGIPASEYISSLPLLQFVIIAVTTVAALVIVQLSGWFLDSGRSVKDYGFTLDWKWLRDLFAGFGIGLAGPLILVLVGIAVGWFDVAAVFHRGDHTVWFGIVVIVLANLGTGIWEELLARGVILTNAAEGLQLWLSSRQAVAGGVAISALLFGIPHIGQPGIADNPFLLVTWILAGVVLGVLFVLCGNMALVVGIHWAFNIAFQSVFVRTDSNPEEFSAIVRLDLATESPLFEFGGLLEGSAFITVLVLGFLWLLYSRETLSLDLPLRRAEDEPPDASTVAEEGSHLD